MREKTLFKATEVASMLGVDPETVRLHWRKGAFPSPVKQNKINYWHIDDLKQWAKGQDEKRRNFILYTLENYQPKSAKHCRYEIHPHPQGGFYAIEFCNEKKHWQSVNHCCEELVQCEINQRQQRLQRVKNLSQINKTKFTEQ